MRISSLLLARMALMRRPMLWVGILAGLAAGGFILLCGLVMLDGKRDAERQADQAAANIAETIEHDIARTFEMFDLSLQGVIRAMAEPEIARLTGRARQLALFDYAANATYLNAILVLDETGKIVDDSRSLVPPKLNLADRDYFQVHRDNPDVGMYLSHPLKSRFQDGEWSIAISRRISKPDGSFGGVVVGTLDLDYFQSLFANLSLGPGGAVTLFRSDGTLVARKPFRLRTIGRDLSTARLVPALPGGKRRAFRIHSRHGRNSAALHVWAGHKSSAGRQRRLCHRRHLRALASKGVLHRGSDDGAWSHDIGFDDTAFARICAAKGLLYVAARRFRGHSDRPRPLRCAGSLCALEQTLRGTKRDPHFKVGMRYEDVAAREPLRGSHRRCGRARGRMAEGATRSP